MACLVTHRLRTTSILFGIVRNFRPLFRRYYLKNEKNFLSFLFRFWNSQQILNIFKKKKVVIANVLSILPTVIDFIRSLSKKRRFRTSFHSQHAKAYETLVKPAWEHFYHIFSFIWGKIIWNISPLVQLEMFGVFVSTMTADDKYPVRDCENLQFPI